MFYTILNDEFQYEAVQENVQGNHLQAADDEENDIFATGASLADRSCICEDILQVTRQPLTAQNAEKTNVVTVHIRSREGKHPRRLFL